MTGLSIAKYSDTDATMWDTLVKASKNATFLLQRPYMDYHRHRFNDA